MINSLTGLRGIAALTVFLLHFLNHSLFDLGFATKISMESARPYFIYAHYAVDIFFMLSGFIMAYNYQQRMIDAKANNTQKPLLKSFYKKRFYRIYPSHLLALIVLIILAFATSLAEGDNFVNFKTLIFHLTLTNAWILPSKLSWNYPDWSVSGEFLCYILFPFIIRFFKNSLFEAIFMIIILSLFSVMFRESFSGIGAISRSLTGFICGYFLFNIFNSLKNIKINFSLITAAIITTICINFWIGVNYEYEVENIIFTYLLLLGLVFCLARESKFSKVLFANRPMIFLGDISYTLYIFHYPLLLVMKYIIQNHYPFSLTSQNQGELIIAAIICIFSMIFICSLIYYLFEKPLYMRGKKENPPPTGGGELEGGVPQVTSTPSFILPRWQGRK